MKHKPKPSDDALGVVLRRGDPSGDATVPSEWDFSRMRQRIVAEADRRSGSIRFGAPVVATAAVALVTLFLGWSVVRLGSGAEQSPPSPVREIRGTAEADGSPDRPGQPRVRQVQFLTPGGTRVVWLLNPDFDV
jgi:hypothetical protein